MLKQRFITACLMLLIFTLVLLVPNSWPFKLVISAVIVLSAWEWAQLNQATKPIAILFALGQAIISILYCFNLMPIDQPQLWITSCILWAILFISMFSIGVKFWLKLPFIIRLLLGYLLLTSAFVALINSYFIGTNLLLSILAIIWVADSSAYFIGKKFGTKLINTKLAPNISPGKSWEGAIGAVIGVYAVALVWLTIENYLNNNSHSLFFILLQHSYATFFIGLLVLVAISITGDLFESLIKRSVQQKDSSNLLPGHGGFLDRIDALLPTLPASMVLLYLIQYLH